MEVCPLSYKCISRIDLGFEPGCLALVHYYLGAACSWTLCLLTLCICVLAQMAPDDMTVPKSVE